MVMLVQHAAQVYKSIYDVCREYAHFFLYFLCLSFDFFFPNDSKYHLECRVFCAEWCWYLPCENLNTLKSNAAPNPWVRACICELVSLFAYIRLTLRNWVLLDCWCLWFIFFHPFWFACRCCPYINNVSSIIHYHTVSIICIMLGQNL